MKKNTKYTKVNTD